jgi:hypothetical protein
LHSRIRKIFIEEIDILRYISKKVYQPRQTDAYSSNYDFLFQKSLFKKINDWVEKTDSFTKALLHSKIATSRDTWQIFEGRQVFSIF